MTGNRANGTGPTIWMKIVGRYYTHPVTSGNKFQGLGILKILVVNCLVSWLLHDLFQLFEMLVVYQCGNLMITTLNACLQLFPYTLPLTNLLPNELKVKSIDLDLR